MKGAACLTKRVSPGLLVYLRRPGGRPPTSSASKLTNLVVLCGDRARDSKLIGVRHHVWCWYRLKRGELATVAATAASDANQGCRVEIEVLQKITSLQLWHYTIMSQSSWISSSCIRNKTTTNSFKTFNCLKATSFTTRHNYYVHLVLKKWNHWHFWHNFDKVQHIFVISGTTNFDICVMMT